MIAGSLSLQDKVAVVTGGAGGIGSAVCHALADAGAAVVVGFHRSGSAAEALAATLGGGGRHRALAAPVTDSQALAAFAAHIDAEHGRCDLLVNCAGTTRFVPHAHLDQLDDALIDEILATNVRGPFATIRALRHLLQRTPGALIVNISSVAAVTGMGSNVMYCASKAALDSLTRSLARALAPAIRVLSVAPGLVDTDFIGSMDRAWRDEQIARSPLGRLATPKEVAQAVIAAYVGLPFSTGAVIPIDGGRPLA